MLGIPNEVVRLPALRDSAYWRRSQISNQCCGNLCGKQHLKPMEDPKRVLCLVLELKTTLWKHWQTSYRREDSTHNKPELKEDGTEGKKGLKGND